MDESNERSAEELGRRAAALVPGGDDQPTGTPTDEEVTSEPLDLTGEGGETVIRQQPSGEERSLGGGEYPDRATAPRPPAPGA